MTIEQFISKIKDFNEMQPSQKIEYFVYFFTVILGNEGVKSKEVENYFNDLKISKYSNIPLYLKSNSKKTKTKPAKFILHNNAYHLERSKKSELDKILETRIVIDPTNNYFPLELFDNTRGYLQSIALQSASCYDNGLYDACSVMTRKLLEVLIIEAFERHGLAKKIKDNNDNFYFLSDLIENFRSETKWNIGRNAKDCLIKLKKMGDMSAHNRRYFSKKVDVDKYKDDLRIVFEELIHIIDYPTWK